MAKYYRRVDKGIEPGLKAYSNDINTIQTNVDDAVTTQLMDTDGQAFILGYERNPLSLSVATSFIDQSHETSNAWQTLKNHYILQEISITKSSIRDIKLRFKNTSGSIQQVSFKLVNRDVDVDGGEQFKVLKEFSHNIPQSNDGVDVILTIDLHHLVQDSYFLLIERTNIDGVEIRYDTAGGYIGGLKRSIDGVDYLDSQNDLFFEERYCSGLSFDLSPGEAVIVGEKVVNLDTHVTLTPGSSYSPRKDVVYMNSLGILGVFEGIPSSNPEEPFVPEGVLRIATIFVGKDVGSASAMSIDQDDSKFINRPRSQLERLRRLEKRAEWDFKYNSPRRVHILGLPNFMDGGASTNIDFVDNKYQITSAAVEKFYDDFSDTSKINLSATTMDLSTPGTAKIAGDSTSRIVIRMPPGGTPEQRDAAYKIREGKYIQGKSSQYAYLIYTAPFDIFVTDISIWLGTLQDSTGVYLHIIDYDANESVAKSDALAPSVYGNAGGKSLPKRFDFPSYPMLKKGRRYRMIIMAPPRLQSDKQRAGIIRFHTLPITLLGDVTEGTLPRVGHRWIPYPSPVGAYKTTTYNEFIPCWVNGDTTKHATTGTLQSAIKTTSAPIKHVAVDMNLSVPDGTSYELYISNNGGSTFHKMTDKTFTFSSTSDQFVYKLIFNSNNGGDSPVLSKSETKGYAIKFELALEGGTPPASGTLVTTAFDGHTIVRDFLGISTDKFSHFEWLQNFMDPNNGQILVDIQRTDSHSGGVPNTWVDWKTNLTLDEFRRHSVDFDMWDEAPFEENEYNFYCDHEEGDGFYWRFVRFKFKLSRSSGLDISPTVEKIGAVIKLS